jgi:hypothetical protein
MSAMKRIDQLAGSHVRYLTPALLPIVTFGIRAVIAD